MESTTHKRRKHIYPSPQNIIRLEKAAKNPDGTKREGRSMNAIINEALDRYFAPAQNTKVAR